MQKKTFLPAFATLILSCTVLLAEASITAFYDKNAAEQKIIFRCIAKGLEAGNKYRLAMGTASSVNVKDSIDIPQGAKIEKEEKKFIEKDMTRHNPAVKELKAEGYQISVQEVAPQAEVRVVFEISYKEIEKLKAEKNPVYLYISRQFAPDVFYIVDYYEMDPVKLLR